MTRRSEGSAAHKERAGSILIMTLVFVSMFLVIFMSLAGYVNRSYHETVLQSHDELAFQIAESGLNYGRWRLAHDPNDLQPETRAVTDQFAGELGSYTLTFEQPIAGSALVLIRSIGTTDGQAQRPATLEARYGVPSLARYASIVNSDVWYGGTLKGAVHANGGIRMDGSSDSLVTSARETYVCQAIHGCSNQTKPGVWGTGQLQSLWEFPVPAVDYTALTQDLLTIKTKAQELGTYFGLSGAYGYHLVFNPNDTYSLYRVTQKRAPLSSYDAETGWETSSYDIQSEVHLQTSPVPSGGVLYLEDTVWVEGEIRNRVTVASGRFPDNPATNTDIIINGSLTYGGIKDGTRSLGMIAQRHILIPYYGAADYLELNGAFIAQKGKYGRRYYNSGSFRLRERLTLYGMVASNKTPGTAWVNGSGQVISGYQEGISSYDPHLLYGPPPFFPTTGQYEFISWEQL